MLVVLVVEFPWPAENICVVDMLGHGEIRSFGIVYMVTLGTAVV